MSCSSSALIYTYICATLLKLCIPMLAHFSNWEVEICLKNSGQTVVGTSDWYVNWILMKCVRDCDDDSSSNCGKAVSTFPFVKKRNERIKLTKSLFVNCFLIQGGLASNSDQLYPDSSDCCKRLWWLDEDEDCTY